MVSRSSTINRSALVFATLGSAIGVLSLPIVATLIDWHIPSSDSIFDPSFFIALFFGYVIGAPLAAIAGVLFAFVWSSGRFQSLLRGSRHAWPWEAVLGFASGGLLGVLTGNEVTASAAGTVCGVLCGAILRRARADDPSAT